MNLRGVIENNAKGRKINENTKKWLGKIKKENERKGRKILNIAFHFISRISFVIFFFLSLCQHTLEITD